MQRDSNGSSKIKRWKNLTIDKLKKYIAMILWMGLHTNVKIQGNWSNDVSHQTTFEQYLSYNKFLLIHQFFWPC